MNAFIGRHERELMAQVNALEAERNRLREALERSANEADGGVPVWEIAAHARAALAAQEESKPRPQSLVRRDEYTRQFGQGLSANTAQKEER